MRAHVALVIAAALAWPAAHLSSQSITVNAANGVLHVQAPGFRFIDGELLARLNDGRSVRVEVALTVLAKPGAAAAAQRKQTCVLSYDLWEERFAVTLAEVPARSASHLSSTAAESWCVQQLDVPLSTLGPLARNLPFWIRLESRAVGDENADRAEGGFTLRDLIDALSRRPKPGEVSRAIEAGPFRVQN